MAYKLSLRSRNNLIGVHPDLIAVVERAIQITPIDFVVIEGIRTMERQKELVRKRASRTLDSRHLTGHAVDIAPWIDGTIRWDWHPFHVIAKEAMKPAADELGIPIEWGGDWVSFKDGPHWQLPLTPYGKDQSISLLKPTPSAHVQNTKDEIIAILTEAINKLKELED